MKVKFLATSAIIAALYIAITMLVAPISFGQVQFRIAEIFNHLIAFNPRFMLGVVLGVFFSNFLMSSVGPIDLIFGVGHTILTLGIFIFICKFVKNIWARLVINTTLFTFTMFIIAAQLNLVLDFPFWETWLFVAFGEFVVLAVGAPIMYTLNKRLDFKKLI
ncbi:QueT transporter family protein [Solibacillus sp. A46]|uniref:QueT transporter family protein n=2 Tax=Solibacillus TaxID=648800 RepID=A0ABR8Y0D2_9BACL|nr:MULTISPECIES: QueT transporter family protein [Solibacillus]MBD8032675.1 QueT transporter family protein [Solibacillus merdavium]MBD8037663.1 QueT transporter family protein [Solibacillus faecavium]